MASGVERTELMCSHCGRDTVQEAAYAGRVLTHITCTVCGTVVHYQGGGLKAKYIGDLQQRIRSKPRRLLHRAVKHPIRFLVSLPGAIARQPIKLLREVKTVKADDED